MAIIFIRTLIVYFALLISMRLMGKRQLGEMELSEFIVAALVADLAATALQDIDTPLLYGLIPIVALFCLEIIIAGISLKSVRFRKLAFGQPAVIIEHGKINRTAMLKNRFTLDELMQELRGQGITTSAQVDFAILETSGQLNIILTPDNQPATASQLGISTEPCGYPHIIINEGRVLENNLKLLGRDLRWLEKELKRQNIASADEVYLFTLSDTGRIYCQTKEDSP